MFNKKVLLAALVMASVSGGLMSCNEVTPTPTPTPVEPSVDNEFEQNTDTSQFEAATMYVIGSHWNSWDTATIETAEGCAFTASATIPNCLEIDVVITPEMLVNAEGGYNFTGFKFIAGPSWNIQYGMEDIDWAKSNDAFKALFANGKDAFKEGTSNRSNVEPKAAGTYHIEYYPLNFESTTLDNGNTHSNKFVVTYTPAA